MPTLSLFELVALLMRLVKLLRVDIESSSSTRDWVRGLCEFSKELSKLFSITIPDELASILLEAVNNDQDWSTLYPLIRNIWKTVTVRDFETPVGDLIQSGPLQAMSRDAVRHLPATLVRATEDPLKRVDPVLWFTIITAIVKLMKYLGWIQEEMVTRPIGPNPIGCDEEDCDCATEEKIFEVNEPPTDTPTPRDSADTPEATSAVADTLPEAE